MVLCLGRLLCACLCLHESMRHHLMEAGASQVAAFIYKCMTEREARIAGGHDETAATITNDGGSGVGDYDVGVVLLPGGIDDDLMPMLLMMITTLTLGPQVMTINTIYGGYNV